MSAQSRDSETVSQFEKGFNPNLFDCIDRALNSRLGEGATKTFYYAIQERFKLPQEEFPRKPLHVIECLKILLGDLGFSVVEEPIRIEIERTFQVSGEGLSLSELIDQARRKYLLRSL